jgi:hypothetical protein
MKLTFDVSFESGKQVKVTAGPRDQLAWEQGGSGRAFGELLSRNYKIGDLYSLVHAAMKRQGLYDGSLKDLQAEADVELGSEESDDDDHPTHADPTSDS